MWARWSTFLVWALVAASAVFWGLKLAASPLSAPPQTVLAQATPGAGGDWSPLIGVVAPRAAAARSQGVALIAVDGKPPRAYRVGAVIDGEHVLQAVQARAVAIGPRQGPATIALQLAPLPPPATGVPAAAGVNPGGPVIVPPPVNAGVRGVRLPGTAQPQMQQPMQPQMQQPMQPQMQGTEPVVSEGAQVINPPGQR